MRNAVFAAIFAASMAACGQPDKPEKPATAEYTRRPIVGRLHQWVGDSVIFEAGVKSIRFHALPRATYREGVYSVKVTAVITLVDGSKASVLAGYVEDVPRLRTREWAEFLIKIEKYFSDYVWQSGDSTLILMFQQHGGPTWRSLK